MKTSIALAFLLFALFGLANAESSPVLDTDGDKVQPGVEYYVVSAIWGAGGGGLALGRRPGQSCPEIVVQRRSDLDNGTPVIFYNADSNANTILSDKDINIEFVPIRDRLCQTTTVWKLDNYDYSAGKWWVTTDGVKGEPGPNTLTSWFKIEAAGTFGYKLRHCPSVCDSCKTLCSDIGRFGDRGQTRLALGDNGWPWIFKKANITIKQVVNAKY